MLWSLAAAAGLAAIVFAIYVYLYVWRWRTEPRDRTDVSKKGGTCRAATSGVRVDADAMDWV